MDRSVRPFLLPLVRNDYVPTIVAYYKRAGGEDVWDVNPPAPPHSPLLPPPAYLLFVLNHPFLSKMFNGAIAIARMDGQIALVQVVQSNRTSSHSQVIKYTFFGDRNFLANFTSSPPSCINNSDILQFLPSAIKPTGDTLTLPNDVFSQFIACTTANQQELEAKWERAMRGGAVTLR